MLAIPIFRSRVAPALNWCSRVLLFPKDHLDGTVCQEELFTDVANPFERLRILRNRGVTTLICGALSPDLLRYAGHLNLQIICGVAGNIPEVLKAYQLHQLEDSYFRLPGCRQKHCHRKMLDQTRQRRREMMPKSQGKESGRGQGKGQGRGAGQGQGRGPGGRMGGRGGGPGGNCICPACGATAPHAQGTPCTQMKCPECGRAMTRQ
ncbi:NifB/NifX family molybdenum-iron cluster-binding protein [Desulfoferrobacter suflitae]|uniref:NifB/NifX family molybdenum-iron cluster-binding protein n=1 Tax=Desulfoferrobacter suflitae TaxID=2865782 RepID=UPI0021641304|nr:hypothetical protein [Desulfoferrobacter suflitae]MCK8603588.1 hypothetical protein [Desulfoferrobacter suflitae]